MAKRMTTKTSHMGITIQFIEDMAQSSGKGVGFYFNNLTDKQAQAHLDMLKAKGFKFAPTCDDVDAEGRCAGHT
ncbi:hypothetical protein LCGC14_2556620 [marine sediment metagenome]|uniref:Uncharacterized protein n=1 Tax=marine sediment metagenome TaxID=412755 RepID=A0A0F9B992_9ZZZZ